MATEVIWPTPERVHLAFNSASAVSEMLADVDPRTVLSVMTSGGFPASARKELGQLIGMKNLSRPTTEIVKRILDSITRTKNVAALRPLINGWINAFNSSDDVAQWMEFLRGTDDAIMVQVGRGEFNPIASVLRLQFAARPDLCTVGLLAAVEFSENPVPALVLLADRYSPAAKAVARLAEEFPDVPLSAKWAFVVALTAPQETTDEDAHRDISKPDTHESASDHYHALLSQAEALLTEAVRVAAQLRSSVDAIGQGKPAQILAHDLSDWTSRAVMLVGPDGSLTEYAEEQRANLARTQAALQARERRQGYLEELVRKIDQLKEFGMPELVPNLLEINGFRSIDELEAEFDGLQGGSFADDAGTDVSTAQAPGDDVAVDTDTDLPDASSNYDNMRKTPTGAGIETGVSKLGEGDNTHPTERLGSEPVAQPTRPKVDEAAHSAEDMATVPTNNNVVSITNGADKAEKGSSADQIQEQLELASPATASDEGALVSESAPLPEDPWSEPTPTMYCQLLQDGQESAALLLAQHREPDSARTKVLAVFTGAFGVRADRFVAAMPDFAPDAAETDSLSADEARVFLAAQLRVALELGYSPIGSLEALNDQASWGDQAGTVVNEAIELTMRGYTRRKEAGAIDLPAEWRRVSEDAEALLTTLSTRRVAYQRSSKIIHFLARDNQTLGRALRTLAALAEEQALGARGTADDWKAISDLATQLGRQDGPTRLIDAADEQVSTAQQRRNPIVADANARLHEAVESVARLLVRGLDLKSAHDTSVQANPGVDDTKLLALVANTDCGRITTPGEAAVSRLLSWISNPSSNRGPGFSNLQDLLESTISNVWQIPRGADGRAQRAPDERELRELIAGIDPIVVVRGYLSLGNRAAAAAFRTSRLDPDDVAADDEIQRSLSVLRKEHDHAIVRADGVVARLRSLGEDEAARELLGQIDMHRSPNEDRFDLSLSPIREAYTRGERALDAVRAELRRRTHTLPQSQQARIASLLDAQDEPLAVEYLTLAESGEPLPSVEAPSGDDFNAFFPAFVEEAIAHRGPQSATVSLIRDAHNAPPPSNRDLANGMKAWAELATHKQGGDQSTRVRRISDVLRMLGLVPEVDPRLRDITKTRNAGYATISVRANPIGSASYVPSLGTQAQGTFHLIMVWRESVSPTRLLQLVEDDNRSKANVILYFGTLNVSQRLELRKLTARAGTDYSPLVVDDAVVAWLSMQPEAGWKVTQRVTLPFTTINPYTPFAGGEVPAEMFVGRESERRQIVDPTGPMFVYGGRQLGKSALLRRIERGALRSGATNDDYVVVYIDLKAAGVGEASPASALWQALAPRLVDAGVLKKQRTWTVDNVTVGITEWLKGDESRRLLLLLDEADNFLTTDAREKGATGLGSFPTLQRLKGLMEQSARRFKPVFAGLHQVQRFHSLPNTPVAHGGQDILIGPLRPVDAQQLVRDPLLALGYQFANDDTMWRLLLFTNNQAGLIQIMCEALIRHVRTLPLPNSGGRVLITDQHVNEVYSTREVRDLIAQRFRWTINLDSRYRMIALVTAFRSFNAAPSETFSAAELQRECEDYWPEGFSKANLSVSEFMRYLDEMTGLGVLHRQGNEFGLRSPNIRSLLGTRADIEDELIEASSTFEVAYEYNPTANRRQLSEDGATDGRRSPLPDSDLAELVSGTHVVVGTAALGIDRVPRAIELVARERQMEMMTHFPANGAPKRVHVVEVTSADDLLKKFRQAGRLGANCVLIARPEVVRSCLAEIGPSVTYLRRWTLSALQSWPDSPFHTSELRRQLKETTGGWPSLIETAMGYVDGGATPSDALAKVEQFLDSTSAREFLKSVDVPASVLAPWSEWFTDVHDDGHVVSHAVPADSIEADLTAAGIPGAASDILADLVVRDAIEETPDGWVIDSAVLRAARSAASKT